MFHAGRAGLVRLAEAKLGAGIGALKVALPKAPLVTSIGPGL